MWWIQPLEIADANGKPTGRWRMTAKSDEGGGGPFGDNSHDHESAEDAEACERCDEYVHSIAGFPSRRKMAARSAWSAARSAWSAESAAQREARDREEYERLKAKFEP